MRPGEKLYEELLTSSEGIDATSHSEIFSAKLAKVDPQTIERELAVLRGHAQQNDMEGVRQDLARLIPENKFGQLR